MFNFLVEYALFVIAVISVIVGIVNGDHQPIVIGVVIAGLATTSLAIRFTTRK